MVDVKTVESGEEADSPVEEEDGDIFSESSNQLCGISTRSQVTSELALSPSCASEDTIINGHGDIAKDGNGFTEVTSL